MQQVTWTSTGEIHWKIIVVWRLSAKASYWILTVFALPLSTMFNHKLSSPYSTDSTITPHKICYLPHVFCWGSLPSSSCSFPLWSWPLSSAWVHMDWAWTSPWHSWVGSSSRPSSQVPFYYRIKIKNKILIYFNIFYKTWTFLYSWSTIYHPMRTVFAFNRDQVLTQLALFQILWLLMTNNQNVTESPSPGLDHKAVRNNTALI